jgi:hypothetical protein
VSDARPDPSGATGSLRIGDAERERAAADLGEHYAQGRLTADEHTDRLEQVWAARTEADLLPLFRDLPGGTYGARPAPPKETRPQRRWPARWLPAPIFAVLALVVLVTVVTHLPFLVFGLLVLWFLTRGPGRHQRHRHFSGHHGCR